MKTTDPFEVEPLPKAFYYPSREKELSKKEKKVCLSAPYTSKDTQHQVSSPEDLKFLKETNTLQTEVPTRENGSTADLSFTSPFNESWPSTEKTGSFGTSLSDGTVSTPEMSQLMREWLEGQEKPVGNSTLGWYINRFRNAPPTDRQQRDKKSFVSKNKPNFWWLSPPSGLSTPSEHSTPVPGHTPPQKLPPSPKKTPSPTTKKRGTPTSSIASPSSGLDDGTTAELDRRAKELLEKSETSIDTMSTEPFPLPLKKPAEYKPTQPKAGPKDYKTSLQKIKTPTLERPAPSYQNPWPEDDILYQWRLARKMEKAQENVLGPAVRVPVKKADPYGIRKPVDTHRIPSQPLNIPRVPGPSTYDDVLPGPSGISTLPDLTTPDITPRTLSSTAVQTPSVITTTAVSSNMGDTIRESRTLVSMVTSCCTGTRPIVTPVLSQPCRHLESSRNEGGASSHEDKLQPHMHLACDILPCQCIGDAQMSHHHQQHPHEIHYKETEDRVSTKEMRRDVTDSVQRTDKEKENEMLQYKKSHLESDLSAISESNKQANKQSHQEKKIKTSSSFESLSSSIETESKKEIRQANRKGKLKQVDNKEKSKENRTFENMLQNVIGEVISEHMFSGQSSTGDTEMKTKDASGTDDMKSKKSTFTQEQGNLLADNSEEEFPDDEILKILRQRSKDLKKELRRIDSLLDLDSLDQQT